MRVSTQVVAVSAAAALISSLMLFSRSRPAPSHPTSTAKTHQSTLLHTEETTRRVEIPVGNRVAVTAVDAKERQEGARSPLSKSPRTVESLFPAAAAPASAAPSAPPASVAADRQICTATAAVELVAKALSDTIFVCPFFPNGGVAGTSALPAGRLSDNNVFGSPVLVESIASSDGAAAALHGSALSQRATVLAASPSLRSMRGTLRELARRSSPAVLHVASLSVRGSDGEACSDNADVMATRDSGVAMLGSGSAQEAYDVALLAHALAAKCAAPALHFFDGVAARAELDQLRSLPAAAVHAAIKTAAARTAAAAPAAFADVPDAFDALAAQLEPVLGRRYQPFEYTGAADATCVIVSVGAPTAAVAEAAAHLASRGAAVGSLCVRLLRPWSVKHFLAALPRTARQVLVLDCSATACPSDPVYLDVLATLQAAGRARSTSVTGRDVCSVSEHGVTLTAAVALFDALSSGAATAAFASPARSTSLVAAAADAALPTGMRQAVLWVRAATDAPALLQNVLGTLHLTGQHEHLHGSAPFPNAARKAPAACVSLRFGPARSRSLHHCVERADFLACDDVELLGQRSLCEEVVPGGTLLLFVDGDAATAVTTLPSSARRQIAQLRLKLQIVGADALRDAAELAEPTADAAATARSRLLAAVSVALWCEHGLVRGDSALLLAALLGKLGIGSGDAAAVAAATAAVVVSAAAPPINYPRLPWLRLPAPSSSAPDHAALGRVLASAVRAPAAAAAAASGKPPSTPPPPSSAAGTLAPHEASWAVMFPEAIGGVSTLRGSASGESAHVGRLVTHRRLTPSDYDRNIFHLEFDIQGSGLQYEMGDALAVHPNNSRQVVAAFLSACYPDADPDAALRVPTASDPAAFEIMTARQLCAQVLDLNGRPPTSFYKALAAAAKAHAQAGGAGLGSELAALAKLTGADEAAKAERARRLAETYSFAHALMELPALCASGAVPLAALPELVGRVQTRLYSIASSCNAHPGQVHLLVVLEDWTTPAGEYRTGTSSSFLASLVGRGHDGVELVLGVQPSLMRLPSDPCKPVVMAGTGTGMAPFRAFLEEKAHQKSLGQAVGDCVLYFGARYAKKEFLYGDEMTQWQREGLLTPRLAWSRDQKAKVYIQHKIAEDGAMLWRLLVQEGGSFYLCGQKGAMPADVHTALQQGFMQAGGLDETAAEALLCTMKAEGRYVIEVY
jgi:sulfite reductase (NADPH) flavoprotein alpha-component